MATAILLGLLALGALAAGILIGRYYVPDDRRLKRTASHAGAYMRTVNYLLARDRDAAVEELKEVVKEDVYDVEPYFALGALFRARGEWERAIRVHQAIALRREDGKDVELRALYELGLDFRAAGMPRRATRAMEDCLAADHRHAGALRALCGLYEELGRYAEAATAWRRLEKLGAPRSSRQVHLLAAAAQATIAEGELDEARELIKEGDRVEAGEPHLAVARAELASARGQHQRAREELYAALVAAPYLAAYLVPFLRAVERARLDAEEAAGAGAPAGDGARGEEGAAEDEDGPEEAPDEDAEERIEERAAESAAAIVDRAIEAGGRDPHLVLARADLRSRYDAEQALEDYRSAAFEYPDLLPARLAAARLALASGDAEEVQEELRALLAAEGPLSWAAAAVWRCTHCGHRDQAFFWRCSSCRRWGEVRRDVGRAAQDPPRRPRERRAAPRGLQGALSSEEGRGGLPEEEDSVFERAGSLLSGVWRRVRRSNDEEEGSSP